jgi:non-ribosomal peptide synthetase component F
MRIEIRIGVIHLNRYRPDIVSMIGMFVNILPCRFIQTDVDKLSFIELLHKVQRIFLESVPHAHLPYDELMNLHRRTSSRLQLPYLQTVFSVDTTLIDYTNMDEIIIGDSSRLSTWKIQEKKIEIGFKFDLDFSFSYDKRVGTIDCVWAYLFDVFQRETIEQHAHRFNQLLDDLFGSHQIEQLQAPLNQIILFDNENRSNDNQVISSIQIRSSCPCG